MPSLALLAPRRLLATTWALMVLLVLGVSALALWQTQKVEARFTQLQARTLPAVELVHEIQRQAEEQRGLAALHLMRADDAETGRLEARMQAQRDQLSQAMAQYERRALDDADRRLHGQVQQRFAAFWESQDRLLALSRRALAEPAAAQAARQWLSGEAQQSYLALRQALDAWGLHVESRAAQAIGQARSEAQQARWWILAWAVSALLLGTALVRWVQRQWPAAPAWAQQSTVFAETQPSDECDIALGLPSRAMEDAIASARASSAQVDAARPRGQTAELS